METTAVEKEKKRLDRTGISAAAGPNKNKVQALERTLQPKGEDCIEGPCSTTAYPRGLPALHGNACGFGHW